MPLTLLFNLTQASKEKKRLDALREKQRLEQKVSWAVSKSVSCCIGKLASSDVNKQEIKLKVGLNLL